MLNTYHMIYMKVLYIYIRIYNARLMELLLPPREVLSLFLLQIRLLSSKSIINHTCLKIVQSMQQSELVPIKIHRDLHHFLEYVIHYFLYFLLNFPVL